MSTLTLEDISKAMRSIDICMMTTKRTDGALYSRPMSNNQQVDYDGGSYFFAYDSCSAAQEITANPDVSLAFEQRPVIGKAMYIAINGKADLVRDRAQMEKHWVKDIEVWFKQGLDTPGLVMIHVKASHIKYWYNYEDGEFAL